MNTAKSATQAVLSNKGDMTSFKYVPILQNLYINPETFLKDIKSVKIGNYEQ